MNRPAERPTNKSGGVFDATKERKARQRDEEFRRQYLQQIKAAAIIKLESALSTLIPNQLNASILNIMKSVSIPMYKRAKSVIEFTELDE